MFFSLFIGMFFFSVGNFNDVYSYSTKRCKYFASLQQMTLTRAQEGVKNNMWRMNRRIIQNGSNHLVHVVLFALGCFVLMYLVSKFSRR
jgi:hypothetical protein